jgi:DNA polymerase
MDSFVAIVTDLAATLDVELQEGRTGVELPPRVVEAFLRPQQVAAEGGAERLGAPVPVSATSSSCFQETPSDAAAVSQAAGKGMDDSADLATVASRVAGCTRCGLHATRTNTVPGAGHPRPEVMFIGEAPGADEDAQGLPFVGRAGQLLTKMIEAMGYSRDEVFIANILKCRPPGNRQPTPQEMDVCVPFLRRQIALVQPKVLVALGATATQGLLHTDSRISQLRGRWTSFEGIPLMPTFHPSYLLRMPAAKRDAWADLQLVLKQLGRTPPPRTASAKDPA